MTQVRADDGEAEREIRAVLGMRRVSGLPVYGECVRDVREISVACGECRRKLRKKRILRYAVD